MNLQMHEKSCGLAIAILLSAMPYTVHAQTATPVKPGLWESQATMTSNMALPPEAEAKIAAMPPAQQAQVRSMMGGGMGGQPTVTTRQECVAPQTTIDGLLNRTQQSPGMQCSVTNRSQTASGASFDITCTGTTGSAKGHTAFNIVDDDHVTSTTHMTMTGSAQGHTSNMTMDVKTSAKFVSADCGNVKPYSPPAVSK